MDIIEWKYLLEIILLFAQSAGTAEYTDWFSARS